MGDRIEARVEGVWRTLTDASWYSACLMAVRTQHAVRMVNASGLVVREFHPSRVFSRAV